MVLTLRPDLMLLSIKRLRAECSTIVRWLKQTLSQMKLVVLVDPQQASGAQRSWPEKAYALPATRQVLDPVRLS